MTEMINEVFLPQALSIDVSYDIFWGLSPKRLEPFFEANKLKQKIQNKNAWLQGIYFQRAIGSAFSKNNKYPDEPLNIFDGDKTQLSDEERFEMWATVANKEFERSHS